MPCPVPLAEFFVFLRAGGEATVFKDAPDAFPEDPSAWQKAFEEECACLPGTNPTPLVWHPGVAQAATAFLYRLCQALANRALNEAQVLAICAAPPALPASPGEVLSSDLALRYLPELFTMAGAIRAEDPLVGGLKHIALLFPFSSVGIALEETHDLAAFRAHPGLWQWYVDRVIERQDLSRLADPDVHRAVVDALGDYPQMLAPKIAARLALDSPTPLASTTFSHHEPS